MSAGESLSGIGQKPRAALEEEVRGRERPLDRTEEAWVSHLLQGEVADRVLTGRGQGRGLLGRRRRGGHKSGLCTLASPLPVKKAVAKGVV